MRRRLLASTALAGVLAACASGAPTPSSVQTVMFEVQAVIGLTQGLAAGIAAAVPQAAGLVGIVTPWFAQASEIFASMAPGMSLALAGTAVQKIANTLTLAVDTMDKAVNAPTAPPPVRALAVKVDEAKAIIAALVTFAEGVAGVVVPTMSARLIPAVPAWVHR